MTRADPQTMPSPAAIAAEFLFWLESRGATMCLNAADEFHFDLNPVPDMTHAEADDIAHAVFALREEIRALLVARRTVH